MNNKTNKCGLLKCSTIRKIFNKLQYVYIMQCFAAIKNGVYEKRIALILGRARWEGGSGNGRLSERETYHCIPLQIFLILTSINSFLIQHCKNKHSK